MPAKSSQFHIQIDGVSLDAAQTKALAADIDKLVSSHLAKIDHRGDVAIGRPIIINKEWLGIWIRDHGLPGFTNAPARDVARVLPGLHQEIR